MKKLLLLVFHLLAFVPFYSNAQCTLTPLQDQTACGQPIPFFIGTLSTGYTTFAWSTSGTGSFDNSATLTSHYTPSATDIAAGSVTLTITASGGSGCTQTTDDVIITLAAAPTVHAGPDQTNCADVTFLNDTYSYTGDAMGLIWTTSGTGIFAPNASTPLNYRASAADTASRSVTLTATTTGNTMCTTVSDQMKITYIPQNFVQVINNNLFSCLDAPVVLSGTVLANASGVTWTTNGTGNFADVTALNPTYVPSAADISAGTVVLTVTTTGNNCPAGTHLARVTISSGNTITPGPDKTVCANVPAAVTASFTGASGIIWASSGGGVFTPNPTSTSVNYVPSAAEISAGKATLTVTTTGSSICPNVTKNMTVTILPTEGTATVSTGPAPIVCAQFVLLNGAATNAKGVVWTSSGSGTFSPSMNHLHATYMMSGPDMTKPSVTLTLTSTGCNTPASSQVTVTPGGSTIPVMQAGADQTIGLTDAVTLGGTAIGVSGVVWTTSGSGIFSDNTSLISTYTPSSADVANGMIRLTLTSTGSCILSDYMYVTIGTAYSISGTVSAGANILDKGLAVLFKQKGNTMNFVAAAVITSGSYSFSGLSSGSYTVMAAPTTGSLYLNTHLPTYSGGTQDWKTGQTTTIASSNVSANIPLSTYTSADPNWKSGSDIISGVIYAANAFNQSFRQIESNDKPIANATVYLTNAAGAIVAYTQTTANGSYSFTNVKTGNYKVVTEFGGAGMQENADPVTISADGNPSTIEDGTMLLEPQARTTGIMSQAQAMKLVAYPNPTASSVSVDLVTSASSGTAKLINQTGMTALQQEVSFDKSMVTLQIESLPAGIYLLQIVAGDEVYTSKVVKY